MQSCPFLRVGRWQGLAVHLAPPSIAPIYGATASGYLQCRFHQNDVRRCVIRFGIRSNAKQQRLSDPETISIECPGSKQSSRFRYFNAL